MRVLVIGKNGYLSKHLQSHFSEKDGWTFCHFTPYYQTGASISSIVGSIYERYNVNSSFDYVINCVGYTGEKNIDDAAKKENEKKLYDLNVSLPYELSNQLSDDKTLCHVSTGCLFYSYKENAPLGWTEEDEPLGSDFDLFSKYSMSKYIAEKKLKNLGKKTYIWRIRLPLCGSNHPKNYINKIMTYKTLLSMNNSMTYIPDFIDAIKLFVHHKFSPPEYGIYNMTNAGCISAKSFCFYLRELKDFNFYDSYEDFMEKSGAIEHRSNCILDSTKIQKLIKYNLKHSPPVLDVSGMILGERLSFCNNIWERASIMSLCLLIRESPRRCTSDIILKTL